MKFFTRSVPKHAESRSEWRKRASTTDSNKEKSWHWLTCGLRVCVGLLMFGGAFVLQAEPRVAGFDEMVVYTPGTMDRDIPGIDLQPDPDFGWQADIQPTLHVHRYYYNGDKEFQGPLLQGGPTIVSACHPRTGKRLYAQVNLPSGAPIIEYEEDSITYVYAKMRVVLTFCGGEGCEEVIMSYKHGRGLFRIHREHKAELAKHHEEHSSQFKLKRSVKDASKAVHDTVKGAAGTATEAASAAVTRAKDTFSALPGVQQLQSTAKDSATRRSTEALKQAADKADEQATKFEKTIR